ncbi:FdhF/YdeP family oxidoreductase [Pseudoxanthomonas indica]|uniref:Oxidoreductase alpha (Molybdopterin) subunit n=1 Tax=Pseudoxanthomonas indica TaxID=428993 RepID=A0A1T5LHA3_9GAMM|nr:FdhF/YdeP family oxidoreductase [Pseudoxanthomonas indica]GGD35286.1 formate dehydrogenase subunit alpha [Pseudoxanthomonas indica]SKC75397.1 oxidoreductase alpha (molybdopterin) subunit [Pseudoxanthomonas indica]
MTERKVPGVSDYQAAAGGWGALAAVARVIKGQMAVGRETAALRRVNQPTGFDCPGCAWPDPKHTSSFEFCENGAKAVSWEATGKRATPELFARYSVAELWEWSDHALEDAGRLTHPLIYDADSDHYRAIEWDEAFSHIGQALRALPDPDMAEFYTSGRTSNEAAFLYQLMVREYGTNNFPDCSNLCHEATSVGLPDSIGVGKGTVTLEDFEHCDAVFSFGHNPGTNHPRMLGTLREVARRGVPIVAVNPLRERGLERFTSPQDVSEMLANRATPIAQTYYQVRIGGDVALLKGMMKCLLDADAADLARGGAGVLDHAFIAEHTEGLEALREDLARTRWEDVLAKTGLSRADIEAAARVYANAERVIICYGMGMTQHRFGTHNVQQMANLLLLRGNIGKPGAGIAPIRGHSNVQGDRTVGITEKPSQALADGIKRTYGIEFPLTHGHDAVESIRAIRDGRSKALICLGGNLAVAMSDPETTLPAMRKLDLAVHIATKLNRSHLIPARQTLLLPCLGRTERDEQASGLQSVTVEDSMSMVHASQGGLTPASEHLRSEPAIVAGIAKATLPHSKVDWDGLVSDYDRIRDDIESVFPIFHDFNRRVREPGGFRLYVGASVRDWGGPGRKARFLLAPGLDEDPQGQEPDLLTLTTVRAHDQYNTTIYGFDDRYRGISGRRDVVFLNAEDMQARGIAHGDAIEVESRVPGAGGTHSRRISGYIAVQYHLPRGSAAMYFPEGNRLVPLDSHDPNSGTPAYKSIPVLITRLPDAS